MSASDDRAEDALPERIAQRDLWRLVALAKPYRRALAVSLGLALLATLSDLATPWVTKLAIDRAVAPPWRVAAAPAPLAARLRSLGALDLPDGTVLVEIARLPAAEAGELEHRHWWRDARFVEIPDTAPDGLATTAIAGRRFAAEAGLSGLAPAERLRLRGGQAALLVGLATLLAAVLVLRFAVSALLAWMLRSTGQRIVADLRSRVIGHLLRLPAAYYDAQPLGRLVTRATNDVSAVEELFTAVLITVVRDCLLIVGGMSLLFLLDWHVALVVVACMPLVLAVSWTFRKRARDIFREVRAKVGKVNAFLAESLAGWRTVQACAQEHATEARFAVVNDEEFRTGLRQMRLNGLFMPLVAFTGLVCAALVILVGGYGVTWGWLTLGGLVAFTAYVEMAFAPIRDLAEKHNLTQAAVAAGERIFALLDQAQEADTGAARPERLGHLAFEDVWFRYPRQDGDEPPWVLQGVSFAIAPGEKVALVGATGSGKTTIAGLMLRFHDPSRGRITADGVDLRGCARAWLRSRIATVAQEVHLYAGTVAENLALFGAADRAELGAAAELVHADRVFAGLPGGLDHQLGERGATLSSGERQLLSLARAVAHRPELLILDEATAHIDSRTEALVQEGLARLLAGRSALIIAHRLSTIRACDRIVVLHHGRVAEQGSHAQLLAAGGLYADLHSRFVAEQAVAAGDGGG